MVGVVDKRVNVVDERVSVVDERGLLSIAELAARAAGAELVRRFGQRQEGVHAKSTPTDLVSDADLAAEAAIRSVLRERRPGDVVLGEEGGEVVLGGKEAGGVHGEKEGGGVPRENEGRGVLGGGERDGDSAPFRWVVDPLDGTVNFLFQIPQFAVSVACEDALGALAGVVLDPIREECFAATRSGPPTLNGAAIRARAADDLSTAMVATGFAYDAGVRARQAVVLGSVLPRVRDIRRAGSAALDLAWTACGRYDAYYERGVHAWDIAAGSLIAARAGLVVRELEATAADPAGVLVAPAGLIEQLYELVVG